MINHTLILLAFGLDLHKLFKILMFWTEIKFCQLRTKTCGFKWLKKIMFTLFLVQLEGHMGERRGVLQIVTISCNFFLLSITNIISIYLSFFIFISLSGLGERFFSVIYLSKYKKRFWVYLIFD